MRVRVNHSLLLLAWYGLGCASAEAQLGVWQRLADAWQPTAFDQLDQALDKAHPKELAFVAELLAERGWARARVLERLAEGPQALGAPAYAVLLEHSGRALAEWPASDAQPQHRARILRELRSADPRIRRAAARALAGLFVRLRSLGEGERIETLARSFQSAGLSSLPLLWSARVEAALEGSDDAASARAIAAAWLAASPSEPRASLAVAATAFVAGDRGAALAGLSRADVRLLRPEALEFAMARLALETPGEARRARALELRAQLWSLRARGTALTLESLLEGRESFVGLVTRARDRADWTRSQQLEWLESLALDLGSAFGRALPGFGAPPAPPLSVEEQLDLAQSLERELESLRRASSRLLDAALRERDPLGPSPRTELEWIDSLSAAQRLERDLAAVQRGETGPALEREWPAALALSIANEWWSENQPERARARLDALEEELERDPASYRWLWGVEYRAEIERIRGAGRGDTGDPAAAEQELLRALERLEGLERELRERGLPEPALESVRARRAAVYVSLAVNANVRLRQPQAALRWFEAGWALRQDDFMRALRACYLARAGEAAEARAMIALCVRSPATLYNLACAHALLGEREPALDLLEQDFDQNLPTRGSRTRQGAWAEGDPDLASLREEPRFRALLAR